MRKIKKFIKKYQVIILLFIVSVLACAIGFLTEFGYYAILIVVLVDILILFLPKISIRRKRRKKEPVIKKSEPVTINSAKNNETKKVKPSKPRKKKKSVFKTIFKLLLMFFFIGTICAFVGFILFCTYIVKNAPVFNPDNTVVKDATRLFDKDGIEFARLGEENREKIEYEELPEILINAIIATEDARFFQHNGFDLPRFMKAMVGQLTGNSSAGGASTLTMQVSKNSFTLLGAKDESEKDSLIRKFTDIYLSIFKIEKNYTKQQILQIYVNTYCLGGNIYGVEQASLIYFGKHAKDLNLSEAAIIAGLFQSPNAYNPITKPDNAAKRRHTVLYLMVRHGYITQKEADIAESIPVEDLVRKGSSVTDNQYQGYIDTVVKEVKDDTGNNPYTVPMDIYTNLDRKKQDVINNAMNGNVFYWENNNVDAGISVLNTKTGAIVAVGTGRNTSAAGLLNNATQIKKQIGSTAKPLYDYGPAVEYNNMSPANLLVDEPYSYTNGPSVSNHDAAFEGLMTARYALGSSRNIPALKVFQSVKKSQIVEFSRNLGLSPEADAYTLHEAHAIGGYTGESPLTVSAAYAAFANGGYYNKPYSYTKIVYRETNEKYEKKKVNRRAMSEATAYIVQDMLCTTKDYSWAVANYGNIGYTYAAKTGTSNFSEDTKKTYGLAADAINDSWMVGITDEYTLALWYGYEKINSKFYSHYGNMESMKLFNVIAKSIFTRNTNVPMPDSVTRVTIERETVTPMLPSAFTPDWMKTNELFKKGSEPVDVSQRFAQLKNPTSLTGVYDTGTITLKWNTVTVDVITDTYLKNYFKSITSTPEYLNGNVSNRLKWNTDNLGALVYDVYVKEDNVLTLIDSTSSNTIDIPILVPSTSITLVVKTSYSKFKTNQSSGAIITVDIVEP